MSFKKAFLFTSILFLMLSIEKRCYPNNSDSLDIAKLIMAGSQPDLSKDSALYYYLKAFDKAGEINNYKFQHQSLYMAGISEYKGGNYKNAINYFFKALKLAEIHSDETNTAIILNLIGQVYLSTGRDSLVEQCYNRSLSISWKIKNYSLIAASYGNLGAFYEKTGRKEKAYEHYLKRLENLKQSTDTVNLFYAYITVAGVNFSCSNYDESLKYYEELLEIRKLRDYPQIMASTLNGIAMAHEKKHNYGLAIHYQLKAMDLVEKMNSDYFKLNYYHYTGTLFYFNKDYKMALNYLNPALLIATSDSRISLMMDLHALIGRCYYNLNNFENSVEHLLSADKLKDSIFRTENTKQISELQVQYETEKKEKENELLRQSNEIKALELSKNKIWLFSLSMALLLALLAGGYIYNRIKIRQRLLSLSQKQKETEFKQKLTELELQALRAQMNPHFIFNCINSIQNCIETNNTTAAELYLSKFAKLLRLILETSQKPDIVLKDEIKSLSLYLELEQLRFHNKFEFNFHVDKSIDTANVEIPNMLLQPFIENAIKHGFAGNGGNNKIKIEFIHNENNSLYISITDNGIGQLKSKELNANRTNHKSTGILNISERLELLNNKGIVQKPLLNITDLYDESQNPAGTKIELNIPV